MDIQELRHQIDEIDDQLVELFTQRMAVAANISAYKKERNLPIYIPAREREKLQDVAKKAGVDMANYTQVLYSMIFELSRSYQSKLGDSVSPLYQNITEAIQNTPKLFPQQAMVACQGVEGAYSQIACEKMFKKPGILYFKNFEGVFSAVEKGFCQYGILPIENSTAGSVNQVYDLMREHNFYVVKSVRIPVSHCLVANIGTDIKDVKEIISHDQALAQCKRYLEKFNGVTITSATNTAVAANTVLSSGRKDFAAICSRECAELYGLKILQSSVQDSDGNYTRFILIAKNLEIFTGANKVSVMTTLPHTPGSLYKTLAKLYNAGINVTKLESRPITNSNFEFTFYFDFECDLSKPEVLAVISELDGSCEKFTFLGAYSENV